MSTKPWDADRELTIETVERVVSEQFPDFSPAFVSFVGSGWENDVYLVNGRWVVRFPRRKEVADRLHWEASVATCFHRRLASLSVDVPMVERWGRPSNAFPYVFTVSRLISGTSAAMWRITPDTTELFARSLGELLGRLHSTPGNQVPDLPDDREGAPEWFAEALDASDDLAQREGSDIVPYLDWLRSKPELPAPPKRLAVTHNDLCPDHVFVDPNTGAVVGLIDVSDASWGDPVLDFGVLPGWLGEGVTRQVIQSYGSVPDGGFIDRLRFSCRVLTLKWLYDAHERGGDLNKHRRWVRNAFSF